MKDFKSKILELRKEYQECIKKQNTISIKHDIDIPKYTGFKYFSPPNNKLFLFSKDISTPLLQNNESIKQNIFQESESNNINLQNNESIKQNIFQESESNNINFHTQIKQKNLEATDNNSQKLNNIEIQERKHDIKHNSPEGIIGQQAIVFKPYSGRESREDYDPVMEKKMQENCLLQ